MAFVRLEYLQSFSRTESLVTSRSSRKVFVTWLDVPNAFACLVVIALEGHCSWFVVVRLSFGHMSVTASLDLQMFLWLAQDLGTRYDGVSWKELSLMS